MNADSKRRRQGGRVMSCRKCIAPLVAVLTVALALAPDLWAQPADKAPGTAAAKAEPKAAAKPAAEKAAPKTEPAGSKPVAEKPKAPEPIDDGPAYLVGKFELSYGREHPDHPALAQFLEVPVSLGKTEKGYVAERKGVATERIRLSAAGAGGAQTFFASAIRRINEQLVMAFNARGLVGIFVAPHQDDIDTKTGQDKRKQGNTTLRLVVWSAVVSRVRTLGAGERIGPDERIDHPWHARIRERSPLKEKDLLNKDKLDDYLFFLNRHPGRQADVAVTSGDKPGNVALDYHISENRPWLVYGQASNTGTEATSKWRYRFGFIHNQFTGNDDILAGEYTTSGHDEPEAQSASGSYEAPFFGMDRLRWRVYGSWGRYRANVPNGTAFGQDFTGYEWRVGGEMIANFYQYKKLFLDAVAGVTWWHVIVNNEDSDITGDADAFMPHVGLRWERLTDLNTSVGAITFEWNCPGIAKSDEDDYERLGRSLPDGDWVVLHWDMLQSFYLEPLLDPEAWRDAASPETSTLAHELAFMFRGQWALGGYRLIPQNERVVGGFFTVRGYPESSVAGDTGLIGTAEYRLHVPRLLKIQPDPTKTPLPLLGMPFRWAPQTVFGRPDWDLILRAFFDVGRTMNTWRQSAFEENHTLMSTGVGVEIQFTRHINVRCDWGFPLRDLDTTSQTVDAGDHRFHFVATVLY